MAKLFINASALKAVSTIVSKTESRYYLKGVYITLRHDHVQLHATDGHRMVIMRHELNKDNEGAQAFPSIIVPIELIDKLKIAKKGPQYVVLSHDEGADLPLNLFYNDAGFSGRPVDGVWPDTVRVAKGANNPSNVLSDKLTYNPAYLHDFAKMAEIMGGKKGFNMPVVTYNDGAPAFVNFMPEHDEVQGFGIIMPTRTQLERMSSTPAWLDSVPAMAKAAE